MQFEVPNVFTSLSFVKNLVIKIPTSAWLNDFHRHVRKGETSPYNSYFPLARYTENDEKNIKLLLSKFPEFHDAFDSHPQHTHFLLVHRLQYDRLRNYAKIKIPLSRYILIQKQFVLWKKLYPTIIQEKVTGVSLLEMYDQKNRVVKSQWKQYLEKINPILQDMLNSDIGRHLNWYIRNFIYDYDKDILWYVDPKPSCIFLKDGNDKNIKSLKERFFIHT